MYIGDNASFDWPRRHKIVHWVDDLYFFDPETYWDRAYILRSSSWLSNSGSQLSLGNNRDAVPEIWFLDTIRATSPKRFLRYPVNYVYQTARIATNDSSGTQNSHGFDWERGDIPELLAVSESQKYFASVKEFILSDKSWVSLKLIHSGRIFFLLRELYQLLRIKFFVILQFVDSPSRDLPEIASCLKSHSLLFSLRVWSQNWYVW